MTQPIVLSSGQIAINHDLTLQGPQEGTQLIERSTEAKSSRLFTVSHGTVTFSHLTLRNGFVLAEKGSAGVLPNNARGAAVLNAASLTVSDCLFQLNAAQGNTGPPESAATAGEGGAIYNSGMLVVERCSFDTNIASGGVAGSNSDGDGPAGGLGAGGAIFNAGSTSITNSTFSFSGASGGAGGTPSTGHANGKGGAAQGGAVANVGSLSVLSSTFAQSYAQGGSAGLGGAHVDNDGGEAMGGALFASNSAGAATVIRSSLLARNLVFGGNSSNAGSDDTKGEALGQNVSGRVQSGGFNLIANGGGSTGWISSDQIGREAHPIDPLLQLYLHDNGGPTFTYSLQPGSPAIDQGNSTGLTTDERGLARVYNNPSVTNALGGDGSDVGAFELQPAPASNLQNVSTRVNVGVGDDVLIGGLIVTGQENKTIVFRAIGPDIDPRLPTLQNPFLELHDANGNIIAMNNDWANSQKSLLEANNLEPILPHDSAILIRVAPGEYTTIVRGVNGGTGDALVEAYDLSPSSNSAFANISSRGTVGPADDAMIAGFILGSGGGGSTKILVRSLGPSLGFGATALHDPTLAIYDTNGTLIASNDNWRDSQASAIKATGFAPADEREAAIVINLPPNDYTAVVQGKDSSSGIAIVEVYRNP